MATCELGTASCCVRNVIASEVNALVGAETNAETSSSLRRPGATLPSALSVCASSRTPAIQSDAPGSSACLAGRALKWRQA